MTDFGIHAAHEQFAPSDLLSVVELAEELGFAAVLSSDHLAPFTGEEGQSGFAWSWLGAAMARTRMPGERWPAKRVRRQRLRESAEMIRELLAGRTVTHDGLVRATAARLFTVPEVPPPLFAATVTPPSARHAAAWADGLVTVGCTTDRVREVVAAYRDAGGRGPVHLQVHVSLAPSLDEARHLALRHWRAHSLPPSLVEDLPTPESFDHVGPGQHGFLQRLGPALVGS